MQKQKRTMVSLAIMVSLITFMPPAQAQFFGGPQFSDDYPSIGGPMGIGPYGMSMPYMYQSEHVTAITRLPDTTGYSKGVMSTLESVPQLSLFTAAVKAAGYDENLRGQGNYIVFAPTDKAIMRDLSVKDVRSLVDDKQVVAGLVNNCIVYRPAGQQPDKENAFIALNGKEVKLLKARTGVSANGADVSNYLGASNGWVIVTDGAVGT